MINLTWYTQKLETNEVIAVNKSKIVLLTILIVLVLYCGAVIFVTKPSTNAYESLFGSKDNSAPAASAPSAEAVQADNKAEHDAILAQAEKVAAEKAEEAKKSASDYADAAIAEAIAKLEIPEAKTETVETFIQGDTIIQREEFDLQAHMPEIVDAVYAQLLKDKDQILDMVIDALIERLGTEEEAETKTETKVESKADAETEAKAEAATEPEAEATAPAAEDVDYETVRRQMREDEIRKMLDQLKD